jgi:hypothetical protein
MGKRPNRQHDFDARKILRFHIPSAWLMFMLVGATLLYIISEEFHLGHVYFNFCLYVAVGVCLLSVIFSYFIPSHPRRAIGVKLMMLLLLLPILLICAIYSFSYCVSVANSQYRFSILVAMIILIVGWSAYSVIRLKQRMAERDFITKEFRVENDEIVVQYFQNTSLESERIRKESFVGRLGDWAFPKLMVFALMGYPLQQVFFSAGGMSAVLLLIATLSFPLTTYIIGRFACGFYLWGYVVCMLEKKHRKPINFHKNE